jgi:glycosyltransferase involved in cell wall biosynthesis
MQDRDYTIVVPVYYNEGSLRGLTAELRREVLAAFPGKSGQILFVDDGSGDRSYAVLQDIYRESPQDTCVVRLTRNFGQVNAWWCGLNLAEGAVVVMSADGQDLPADARRMLEQHFTEDVEIVIGTRSTRDESAYRRWTSQISYWLMRRLCFPDMPHGGFDFFVLGARARAALLKRYLYHGFLQGQILQLGYRRGFVECHRRARTHGTSRWSFSRKLNYLLDGILGYSFLPIRFMSLAGLLVAILGFIYALMILIIRLNRGLPVQGWAPLMIVVLIVGGLQMMMLGVIGEYLWRTFAQVRGTPPFLVEEVLGERRNG